MLQQRAAELEVSLVDAKDAIAELKARNSELEAITQRLRARNPSNFQEDLRLEVLQAR